MENLVKIAEDVLTSCLAVKTGEEVLIITDDSRKEIGEAIYEAAGNLGCEKLAYGNERTRSKRAGTTQSNCSSYESS